MVCARTSSCRCAATRHRCRTHGVGFLLSPSLRPNAPRAQGTRRTEAAQRPCRSRRSELQNAALAYLSAIDSIDTSTPAWKEFHEFGNSDVLPLTPHEFRLIKTVVEENGTALSGATDGSLLPLADWKIPAFSFVNSVDYGPLHRQRDLATVLQASAIADVNMGRSADALRRVTELLALSRAMDQHPSAIGHLMGLGMASVAASLATTLAMEIDIGKSIPIAKEPLGDRVGPVFPQLVERDHILRVIDDLLEETHLVANRQRAVEGERAAHLEMAQAMVDGSIAYNATPTPTTSHVAALRVMGYVMRPVVLTDARLLADYATTTRAALAAPDYPTFLQCRQALATTRSNQVRSCTRSPRDSLSTWTGLRRLITKRLANVEWQPLALPFGCMRTTTRADCRRA